MTSKTETQTLPINNPPIKKRKFGLLFIFAIALASIGYYTYTKSENSYINHDYYRVLYEASKEFNNNLSKLERSLVTEQTDTSIRSILPTFKFISDDKEHNSASSKEDEHRHKNESYEYILEGSNIVIKKHVNEQQHDERHAEVSLDDLLPTENKGFSQLIFASNDGKVIHSNGGEKNISFADLTSIKSEITKQNTPMNFSTKVADKTSIAPSANLPSYSSHFDMNLSYGDFRVFIFPFKLDTKLTIHSSKTVVDSLYLVALLPKYELNKHGNGQLNVTLLVVVVISLLTTLAVLRLYLLPNNQSITGLYRYFLQASSYIFFFVIVAMILAYLSMMILQEGKDKKASDYAIKISESLETDLNQVFTGLSGYRVFYQELLPRYKSRSEQNKKDEQYECSVNFSNESNESNEMYKRLHIATAITKDNKYKLFPKENKAEHFLGKNDSCRGDFIALDSNIRGMLFDLNKKNKDEKKSLQDKLEKLENKDEKLKVIEQKFKDFEIEKIKFDIQLANQSKNNSLLLTIGEDSNLSSALKALHHLENFSNMSDEDLKTYNSNFIEIKKTKEKLAKVNKESSLVKKPTLVLLSGHLNVNFIKDNKIETYLNAENKTIETYFKPVTKTNEIIFKTLPKLKITKSILPNNLSSVFTLDNEGNTSLPTISYRESNSTPLTTNLSHREYFKRVRDNKAWDLTFDKNNNKNVYIQRLHNIHNGSRGTTISMPLFDEKNRGNSDAEESKSYVLGADVLLPSVEMRKPSYQGLIFMIIDRNNGEVLFHSDESRTMIENFFYSSKNQSEITQWIKASLDKGVGKDIKAIKGNYHSQAGRFFVYETVVDNWATVVFYPDDSLNAIMASQFFYLLFSLLSFTLLMFIIAYVGKRIIQSYFSNIKGYLFPKHFERLFLFNASLVCTGVFSLLSIFDLDANYTPLDISVGIVLIFISLSLLYYYLFLKHFTHKKSLKDKSFNFISYISIQLILFISVILIQIVYFNFTRNASENVLLKYEQDQYCNEVNRKRNELNNTGLRLFPNSITKHNFKATDILTTHEQWNLNGDRCENYPTEVLPEDFPMLSSQMGVEYYWQSVSDFLNGEYKDIQTSTLTAKQSGNTTLTDYKGLLFLLLLTIAAWMIFTKKILWKRLYCSPELLKHINGLASEIHKVSSDEQTDRLTITCGCNKLNGIDLNCLLGSQSINNQFSKPSNVYSKQIVKYFTQIYSVSALLQSFVTENTYIPNVKLNIENSTLGLDVEIYDIEVCLDEPKFRFSLLRLIMEMKSLTLLGVINSFNINAGFHSLQRVDMKNLLSADNDYLLEHTEYLSWSECLMDFTMVFPKSFSLDIDEQFLSEEIMNFPEIQSKFANSKANKVSQPVSWFWQNPLLAKTSKETSTIRHILMHVESIYRFKWELCSSAEKLALYNLAKQRKLNPRNAHMIEHLAMNGLIRVDKDHLTIINKSFAEFVLNAESNITMRQLELQGEEGIWKSYRVPIVLLVVLVIGGIAMTSGKSIAIIGASMLGILTTIASVTNSANLLKNQMK